MFIPFRELFHLFSLVAQSRDMARDVAYFLSLEWISIPVKYLNNI